VNQSVIKVRSCNVGVQYMLLSAVHLNSKKHVHTKFCTTRFKVLPAQLLKLRKSSRRISSLDCLTLKVKTVRTCHPETQCHMTGYLNLQQYHGLNFKYYMFIYDECAVSKYHLLDIN